MISLRKQMFALFLGTGLVIVLLVRIVINTTLYYEFETYLESNVEYVAMSIANKVVADYNGNLTIKDVVKQNIYSHFTVSKCAIMIQDSKRNNVYGVDKVDLVSEIYRDKNFSAPMPPDFVDSLEYIEIEIPVVRQDEIVAYVQVGYFPLFLFTIEDTDFQNKINSSIQMTVLITMGSSILVALYLTRMFSKPIYAISEASIELAKGNYDYRYINRSKIHEIETLRHSINNLAERLEEEDQTRKKLISDVSHEIRTPLHVLQSNLEAMIDGIYPTDEEQMLALHKEVVRFSTLLSNLDKLKGIESAETCKLAHVNLNKEITDVYNNFNIKAIEADVEYNLNIAKTSNTIVNIDTNGFRQIMTNLLSNAFKFTHKGSIGIRTEIKGRFVIIEVKDTGIGINKEDQKYIFDRMYRGDKSREQYAGSGIGLTIAKKLAVQMGGEIYLHSKEGKGTSFYIHLPIVSNEKIKIKH